MHVSWRSRRRRSRERGSGGDGQETNRTAASRAIRPSRSRGPRSASSTPPSNGADVVAARARVDDRSAAVLRRVSVRARPEPARDRTGRPPASASRRPRSTAPRPVTTSAPAWRRAPPARQQLRAHQGRAPRASSARQADSQREQRAVVHQHDLRLLPVPLIHEQSVAHDPEHEGDSRHGPPERRRAGAVVERPDAVRATRSPPAIAASSARRYSARVLRQHRPAAAAMPPRPRRAAPA